MGTLPTADALRPVLEQLGGPAALVRTAFEVMAAVRGLRSEPVNPALLGPSAAQFAGLEIEELGYLYESLLEAGSRKHAGAHYTPRALADEVVLHALEPLVHDTAGSPLSSAELLDLRVADITSNAVRTSAAGPPSCSRTGRRASAVGKVPTARDPSGTGRP